MTQAFQQYCFDFLEYKRLQFSGPRVLGIEYTNIQIAPVMRRMNNMNKTNAHEMVRGASLGVHFAHTLRFR